MSSTIDESKKLAGGVIIAGFEGTSVPGYLMDAIQKGGLGGLILFRRNVENPLQVSALLDEAGRAAPPEAKLIASVDQEGGKVVRLHMPLTVLPPARRFGQLNRPDITQRAGRLVGMELRALGFTLNFAPVLDVDTNPDSPIIADRSYGSEVRLVVGHGLAFARGLRDGGTLPCAKHFPGHGDASSDSHVSLPRVEHDRERLEAVEMEPFAAWARTGLGPVMGAHVFYTSLDREHPATTSYEILRGDLRDRLRFRGAILSDDLEMGAVQQMGSAPEVAVKAIRAGIDGLLVCRRQDIFEAVCDALAREAVAEPAFFQRLVEARDRLRPLAHPPGLAREPSWIGSDGHRRLQDALVTQLQQGEPS